LVNHLVLFAQALPLVRLKVPQYSAPLGGAAWFALHNSIFLELVPQAPLNWALSPKHMAAFGLKSWEMDGALKRANKGYG